jgi:hypothetical protein
MSKPNPRSYLIDYMFVTARHCDLVDRSVAYFEIVSRQSEHICVVAKLQPN